MKENIMKMNNLKKRLQKDRSMVTISMRIPEDVVDDLKRVAPLLGFSGYQPLMRAYIGQGLRVDLERFEGQLEVNSLISSLRKQGVDDALIARAMAEAGMAETG